jgi:hypothetical protein
MASSGSFNGSIKSGNYKLLVDWSATQSVANNTSKITATMYLVIASGWSINISTRSDNTITIAGTDYTWSSPAINKSGSTTKLATVTSGNIAHSSDGSKSVTFSATFYIRATISGTYYEKITASTTVTLDSISRATTPKLSATSVDMGSLLTISLPRESSSLTHDLAYAFAGSGYVTFKTNAGTSYLWYVPDLASKIPNGTSGTMTIRCTTKNGSTTVGTKSVTLTVKVPTTSDFMPSISSVSHVEAVSGLAARFGAYIQSKSKIKATITASGAKGSTIKSVSTTFLGSTYTGTSWTSDYVSSSGSIIMKTTVTDSRGRTATKNTTITVTPYSAPKVTTFEASRVNAAGEADTEGEYVFIKYAYSVLSLNGGNTADMEIQYKESTATSWTTLLSGTALSANETYTSPTAIFSSDNQYDVRLVVTDYFGQPSNAPSLVPSGEVIVDFLADGSGIGIGKVAELSGVCDMAMQLRMQGGTMHVLIPTGTDLDELRTPGRYVGEDATGYSNCPFSGGVTFDLDVIAAGKSGQTKQVITECTKEGARTLQRFFYSGSWSAWSDAWYELPDGTDLDTLLSAGDYRLPAASSYANAPEDSVGAMLEVMGRGTIIQRWTTASKTSPREYERAYFSSAWGDWIKTYDPEVGKVYSASKSVKIATAGIDTLLEGAAVTVPAGTYVVIADAVFNTGTSTGTRNNQVLIAAGDTVLASERVFAAASNYAKLQVSAIYIATGDTKLVVKKSSSITEDTATATLIKAVKIL